MTNIAIYPIRSELAGGERISAASAELLSKLEKATGYAFTLIEDLDAFHDGDLGLILVQSGGSEEIFKDQIFPKIDGPYYLLTYGAANSLAASLEILSFIQKQGKEGEILHGPVENVAERLGQILKEKGSADESKYDRLGVIGRPSDWLIASEVDYTKAKKLFKTELVDLTTQELIWDYASTAAKMPSGRVQAEFNPEELDKAYRLYKAMKQIIKDHSLTGLTIRCFDLLGSLKTTACLSLALLNEKGAPAACEGDIPALLTMYTVLKTTGLHCFQANPAWIDEKENSIIFAHCTLPLDLAEKYEFNTHFESGIGVGIHGEMRKGPVTVVKLSSDLRFFYCGEGELLENQYRDDRCRTQIKLKMDEKSPVRYFLTSPLGNHHLICYGHQKAVLEAYYRSLGLKDIEEEKR